MTIPETGESRLTQRARHVEYVAAHAVAFVIAIRYRLPPDIPIGFLLSVSLLPVTFRVLGMFRGSAIISALALASSEHPENAERHGKE